MIIIHAEFQIQPAKEQDFLVEIQPLIAASKAESGNIAYDLHKHTGREHVYTMVEIWKDGEATAIHSASEHYTSFIARAGEFLAAPPKVNVYNGEPVSK
ncbi:monooxygenase [Paenibacillus pectinilyticus]|uniref:Monooxygenase n=1 Tax=Paenibacillus pectinilyticus TaxID=512399 RepID=A0A1C0ZUX3_9BACL|nr:putative quinol monooxygenase [Paenibacillus pectinilyticus]OCT11877.1 monooxygenase [Paenibacillus pectinilyticus]